MSELEVDEYYKRQAKELTSVLFDKRFLNDQLNLESIDWLEDYIGFIIQTHVNSAVKCTQLLAKVRDRKVDPDRDRKTNPDD